jgi:hypothetical protein
MIVSHIVKVNTHWTSIRVDRNTTKGHEGNILCMTPCTFGAKISPRMKCKLPVSNKQATAGVTVTSVVHGKYVAVLVVSLSAIF